MNRPKLLEAIETAGMSQRRLAKIMKMRPSTFNYKTQNRHNGFTVGEARQLCCLLGISDPATIVAIFFSD